MCIPSSPVIHSIAAMIVSRQIRSLTPPFQPHCPKNKPKPLHYTVWHLSLPGTILVLSPTSTTQQPLGPSSYCSNTPISFSTQGSGLAIFFCLEHDDPRYWHSQFSLKIQVLVQIFLPQRALLTTLCIAASLPSHCCLYHDPIPFSL